MTNESESDIIEKLLKKQSDLLGNITEKTFEKKMKKVLDKSEKMWYNRKAAEKNGSERLQKTLKKLEKSTWQRKEVVI